jgi:hypothetical protein
MMQGYMKIIYALLCTLPLFASHPFEVERGDGSKIIGYIDKPEAESFSITLIIPGSQKETALRTHDSLKDELVGIGHCALTLEKQGVTAEQIDEKEFIRFLSLDERLGDHLLILKKLKSLVPGWDGNISILGQGDGGRIGARLATQTENVAALILIASGGGWTPLDEALYSFRSEMADGGFSPQYIHGFIVAARQEFAQAIEAPKTDQKAFGYSYKYWASVLKTNLLSDLVLLKCPIYSVNGVKDNRVPIESVDAMSKHLNNRLTLKRKEKAGREIIQDHKVYAEAISWLDSLEGVH